MAVMAELPSLRRAGGQPLGAAARELRASLVR